LEIERKEFEKGIPTSAEILPFLSNAAVLVRQKAGPPGIREGLPESNALNGI
jgi:hypothetical protein